MGARSFSVVFLAYNMASRAGAAIASDPYQGRLRDDGVVVDDGSTDATLGVAGAPPTGAAMAAGTARAPRPEEPAIPAGAARPSMSIVMPSHDNVAYLARAVDSALKQSLPALEVIVVDDGSVDGSAEVLRGYGDAIRLLEVAPCTIGAARNAALREARGDYVVLLDADDVLLPWAIEALTEAARAHGRPTLVMSRWQPFESVLELPTRRQAATVRSWPDFLAATEELLRITTATAVRTAALKRAGGFHSATFGSEDMDLWLRLGTHPGFVYLDGAPLYGYRQHAASATHTVSRLTPGIRFLMRRERAGVYPGGPARALARRRLIARNVEFAVGRCWKLGATGAGYRMLLRGLPWFVESGLVGLAWRAAIKPPRATALRVAHAVRAAFAHGRRPWSVGAGPIHAGPIHRGHSELRGTGATSGTEGDAPRSRRRAGVRRRGRGGRR